MISQVHTNIGIFIIVMPGRMFRMVVMMLIEPMIDEAPMMCTTKDHHVHAHPCLDGKRRIERPATSRSAAWDEERTDQRIALAGSSQNDQLFMRAKGHIRRRAAAAASSSPKPTRPA